LERKKNCRQNGLKFLGAENWRDFVYIRYPFWLR
jgi:hypothetical protein